MDQVRNDYFKRFVTAIRPEVADRELPLVTLSAEVKLLLQSWLGKSAQRDKWRFCLTAARMAA
jgi:hypothetical protein